MSNLPTKAKAVQLPAHLQKYQSAAVVSDLTGGVQSGFPVISYRGKVWRIRKGGHEENYLNDEGEAMPSIEVVIIRANPQPSKIYYEKAYEEGGADAPRCWSANGVKPDSNVKQPIAKACAVCPNNEWGSKITPTGAKTRLCGDARRMAVAFTHELADKGKDAHKFLMRIPPASLNPLKDYAEKVLNAKGIPYFAVSTKVGFDPNVAYPKLTFKAARFLTEEELELVEEARENEDVKRILAESHEFTGEDGTTGGDEAVGAALPTTPQKEAPAPSAPTRKAAPKPVEAEDVDFIETPAPKVAAVIEDEDEDELPTPTPVPAKPVKKAKKTAAPAPKTEDSDVEVYSPSAPAGEDMKAMLDSILGD
jgi:hypothetical protein